MKGLIRSRNVKYGGIAVILTVLTLVAVIILNIILSVLAGRYSWMYFDMNSSAVFDISDKCEDYLTEHVFSTVDKINEEYVKEGKKSQKIKIIFCDDEENIKATTAQKYILDSIYQLTESFPGYIEIDYINIWEQPTVARAYGVTSTSDVVCLFDGKKETMSLSDFYIYSVYDTSNAIGYNGEKVIASCLMRLTQENSPMCYFTANHGESFSDYEFIRVIVESGYTVGFLDLSADEIPEDCDLLVTFAPKQDLLVDDGISAVSEVDKLDAYMSNGGKYMVFLSADSFASGPRSNLEGFLAEWGITYEHEKGSEGVENCYLVKDSSHSLTVDGYTVMADKPTRGEGVSVMNGLPENNVFGNSTCISFAEGFIENSDGNFVSSASDRERTAFTLMSSHASAEAWTDGRAVARASDERFTLMAMTTQKCENGKTAYLVTSASTDFASEQLMQSTSLGNSRTLMGIISYMGKTNAPVQLVYKPFGSTDLTALTTRDANILTIILVAIPALGLAVLGTVTLIRRKHS